MKISVIIPVYNVERYLKRCLDSVLASAQELLSARPDASVEVLCVNDGSTDSSAAILDGCAGEFRAAAGPRLSCSVVTKPNGGLGSARNAGLDAMTGDYVTFVDSDDYILPHTLATFAAVAEKSGAALVVSSAFLRDDRLAGRAPSAPAPRFRILPAPKIAGRKVQYSAWNKLYRADLFRNRRYPPTVYEDFPVTTDVFCAAREFALVDAPLYVYCLNAGAASLIRSPFSERKLRDSLAVVRMVCETARRQSERPLHDFALRQAADGLSSTVGHVYRAKDGSLRRLCLSECAALARDFPGLSRRLTLKAAFRLWRMRRLAGVHCAR